ncbi:MAG: hypothetical protein JKY09_00510 [Crocinitomicaceae bacterium]|nr:hypothetical protein [Crocinitomicaceae bacterium]
MFTITYILTDAGRLNSLIIILLLGGILGCKKENLEGETSILEGKWKWVSSKERKWNFETDTYDYTTYPSSNYSDEYFIEFERKGKVKYYKNDEKDKEYRVVLHTFEEGCTSLTTDCYFFNIYLNNDSKNGLAGGINKDTIVSSDTNLPLERLSEIHTYSHTYIRVN